MTNTVPVHKRNGPVKVYGTGEEIQFISREISGREQFLIQCPHCDRCEWYEPHVEMNWPRACMTALMEFFGEPLAGWCEKHNAAIPNGRRSCWEMMRTPTNREHCL